MDVSFQRSYFIVGEVFGLPNIKSAKKRVLVSEARNARNKANRSALKTAIKKFEAAAVEGNRTEAEGAYKVAVKSIDKAAPVPASATPALFSLERMPGSGVTRSWGRRTFTFKDTAWASVYS